MKDKFRFCQGVGYRGSEGMTKFLDLRRMSRCIIGLVQLGRSGIQFLRRLGLGLDGDEKFGIRFLGGRGGLGGFVVVVLVFVVVVHVSLENRLGEKK